MVAVRLGATVVDVVRVVDTVGATVELAVPGDGATVVGPEPFVHPERIDRTRTADPSTRLERCTTNSTFPTRLC